MIPIISLTSLSERFSLGAKGPLTILEYESKDITLSRMYFQIRFIFSDLFQFQRIVRCVDGHSFAYCRSSIGIYRGFMEVGGLEPVLMV